MGEKENASFTLSDPRVVFVAKVAHDAKSPQVRNANCGRNQCNRTYPIKRTGVQSVGQDRDPCLLHDLGRQFSGFMCKVRVSDSGTRGGQIFCIGFVIVEADSADFVSRRMLNDIH